MALFGEKYGYIVRTVTINPEFSFELCGGTHAKRAGDIGLFQLIGESSIAAGIRRVEAITAPAMLSSAQQTRQRVNNIATLMKTPIDRIEEKITILRNSLKDAEKQLEEMHRREEFSLINELMTKTQQQGDIKILLEQIDVTNIKTLRNIAMQLKTRLSPVAIMLATENNKQATFMAAVSNGANINAREWMQKTAAVAGAQGGGKDDFAQAGGGDTAKIKLALQAARDFIG